jgi:hypothetical protein
MMRKYLMTFLTFLVLGGALVNGLRIKINYIKMKKNIYSKIFVTIQPPAIQQ